MIGTLCYDHLEIIEWTFFINNYVEIISIIEIEIKTRKIIILSIGRLKRHHFIDDLITE